MPPSGIVFLFNVDNTLLDNDPVTDDLQRYLEREVGHERKERDWTIFEQLRVEWGMPIIWRSFNGIAPSTPVIRVC